MLRTFLLVGLPLCALCGHVLAAKPSFHALGDVYPWDVSTDGKVVVGNIDQDAGRRAFQWTRDGGVSELASPEADVIVRAVRVSGDGTTIFGSVDSAGYRWSTTLGDGFFGASNTRDVTYDGTTTVVASNEAFVRQVGETPEYYVWPIPGDGEVEVFEANPDASTIVGHQVTDSNQTFPLRWNEQRGFDEPGKEFADLSGFTAIDVSADGQTVMIRSGLRGGGGFTYLWNDTTGLTTVSANEWRLNAMDDSGRLLAGGASSGGVIWDENHGFRDLQSLLETKFGLADDLDGWYLLEVMELSGDGRTFVGRGLDPAGRKSAWVATIPEPSTIGLLCVGGAILGLNVMIRKRTRT